MAESVSAQNLLTATCVLAMAALKRESPRGRCDADPPAQASTLQAAWAAHKSNYAQTILGEIIKHATSASIRVALG